MDSKKCFLPDGILVLFRGCTPIIPSTPDWESSGAGDASE